MITKGSGTCVQEIRNINIQEIRNINIQEIRNINI
jgi:hypothetical protein